MRQASAGQGLPLIRCGADWRRLLSLGFVLVLLGGCAGSADKDAAGGDAWHPSAIADAVPKVEPKSRYGNPKSYVVFGKRYYTKASSKGHLERGLASWYGKKFHGRKTSNGERYDMYAMTAAHKSLPLPTYAQVTNLANGRRAVVRINDRGPFHGERVIDLSYAAARKLGVVAKGTAMVEVRAIDPRRWRDDEPSGGFFVVGNEAPRSTAPKANKPVVTQRGSAVRKATRWPPASTPEVAQWPPAKAPAAADGAAPGHDTSAPPTGGPAVALGAADPKPRQLSVSSMYLQVGAFGNRMNAEQLRRRLVDQIAEEVQIRAMDGKKARLYRVHVGPLQSRQNADDLSQRLASLGLRDSHVVRE